jgi:hypothetical protein
MKPSIMPESWGVSMTPPLNRGAIDRRETSVVLLQLLETDLQRRHWRVAIRRFLMLLACGVGVPDSPKAECEALLLACPARDLRRIRDRVQSWVDMMHPRSGARQRQVLPADEFAHLYAWSRRPASVRGGTASPRQR